MAAQPADPASADTGVPIPASKVTIPVPPEWVIVRTRLTDRLAKATRAPLTVVTGPPGAGKTLAVAAWASSDRAPGPVAWISLDEGDDRPEVLWPLVLEALRRAGVDPPDGPVGGVELATDLAPRDPSVVVVMDDVQAIRASSTMVHELEYLVRHAAPGLRLVLVSRRDPPLTLQRHRLAGVLSEVRTSDLGFGEREARELLARRGVTLSAESVRRLRDRTEGWAAGISLAAMSMVDHPDPETFVAELSGDDHAIASYLIEEVLNTLPEDARGLLLATSVVPRVNAELAAELAGAGKGRLFPDLVQRIAFVQPLDHGWYRYHPLLAETMQLILRHESPGASADLHRRAAGWFEREGLVSDAIRHATLARDWRYACWLVATRVAVGQVLGLGVEPSLAQHFRAMPPEVVSASTEPEPAIVAAADALARDDDPACALALKHADDRLAELPGDGAAGARLAAGVVRVARPYPHDAGTVQRVAAEAASLLGQPVSVWEHRPELRALLLMACGLADLWAGRLASAAARYDAALDCATAAGWDPQLRSCLGGLALVEAMLGRFGRAAELVARADRLPVVAGPAAGWQDPAGHLASGWIELVHCRLAAARRALDRAGRALEAAPDDCLSTIHSVLIGQTAVAEGRLDRALASLAIAQQTAAGIGWLEHRVLVATAEALVAGGDAAAARAMAERAGGTVDALVVLARAQCGGGDVAAARQTLRITLADTAAPSGVRVDAWLTDAHLAYGCGDSSRGRRSLDHALRVGDREQLSLPFALSRSWLLPILRRDPDLLRRYQRLLEPVRIATSRPAPDSRPGEQSLGAERLSPRELDVLRHLSAMMTTAEIAAATYLSANTVKTHLKSIYRKLAVTRRGEAVRRARQLELL
jgi:LuxR family transcriptional regulator, maltose regulon positive regulatory protein